MAATGLNMRSVLWKDKKAHDDYLMKRRAFVAPQ